MAARNHTGKTMFVSDVLPETNDAAGFEALTWVEVKHAIQLPQLGITHAQIEVPDLKSGFTQTLKGAGQGVESQAMFADRGDDDAGQLIVRDQANGDEGLVAIKIVKGTGPDKAPAPGDKVQYARGFFHTFQERQPTVEEYEGFEVTFRQNDFTVVDEEPA